MSKYILGISLGQDASAALIVQDGDNAIVIAAVSEERFTRKKHEERFPVSSVNYVISLLPTDGRIEIVAYCTWERDESYGLWWRWLAPLGIEPQDYLRNVLPGDGVLQLRRNIALNPSAIAEDQRLHREMIRGVLKDFTALPLDDVRLVRVEHHVAHALCGWGLSNLEECTILTADGHGDGLSLTLNRASTGNAQGALGIDRLFSIGVEGSLGMFYKYVTQGLGFRRLSQEGKVTGLAAYGDPNVCHDKLMELFLLDAERPGLIRGWNIKRRHIMEIDRRNGLGGRYHPIPAWIEFNAFGLQTVEVVEDLLATGTSPADVAAGAQSVLEHIVLAIIRQAFGRDGRGASTQPLPSSLVLAGGVFANVKLNQRILCEPYIDRIFAAPPMGDQGVAIGAALAGNIVLSAKPNLQVSLPKQFTTMALGPEYSDRDIDSALESAPGRLAVYRVRDSHRLAGMIAKALTDGKIVARLNGRMEFGPRALGNRSILAPATSTIYADRLNNALQRDDFMPFAPMTLEAHADSSFNLYHKATGCAAFMTTSLSTSSAFGQNYPAVNHVDGTARPQVVGRAQSDAFDILSKYQELTGLNTIINTSFNMHGEPIVESPQGAIATFLASGIDHLAAGSYFISRESDAKADA